MDLLQTDSPSKSKKKKKGGRLADLVSNMYDDGHAPRESPTAGGANAGGHDTPTLALAGEG